MDQILSVLLLSTEKLPDIITHFFSLSFLNISYPAAVIENCFSVSSSFCLVGKGDLFIYLFIYFYQWTFLPYFSN